MGGIVTNTGKQVSTALSTLSSRRKRANQYDDVATSARQQAAQNQERLQEEETYLLKSAAERSREIYQKYRQQLAAQQTVLAQAGLRSNSVTAQQLLKNARLAALAKEDALQQEQTAALNQKRQEAAQREIELKRAEQEAKKAARKARSPWRVVTDWFGWGSK